MLKKIVIFILRWEAKSALNKFHPRVVAITGSVGKTSAKEAIAAVLGLKFSIRKSPKSYNSELGVPLTILGLSSEWQSGWGWIKNIVRGIGVLFAKNYPEVLVLEMGVDRPGDMDAMAALVSPFVGVVTAIGEVPVHVEFFPGPTAVAEEKGKMLEAIMPEGFSVLNGDDDVVRDLAARARGTTFTFGFGAGSDIRISQYRLVETRGEGAVIPEGIAFKLDYRGSTLPVRIQGAFGKQQTYAAAAAVAVGAAFGLNPVEMVEALGAYTAPPGRLRAIEGIRHSIILDDSYNASPIAMHAALDVLRDMPATRRIAVLGDMLEIGKFTIPAHQAMGELAASLADIVWTVGPRAKFIAKEARDRGMAAEAVREFSSSTDAASALQEILQAGDVVLVKGSQSMRMERVTEAVMAHPEEAPQLLCRQEEYWKRKE